MSRKESAYLVPGVYGIAGPDLDCAGRHDHDSTIVLGAQRSRPDVTHKNGGYTAGTGGEINGPSRIEGDCFCRSAAGYDSDGWYI